MNRETLKVWFFLFRSWSYTATLVPFLVAAGLFGSRTARWGRWGVGFFCGGGCRSRGGTHHAAGT